MTEIEMRECKKCGETKPLSKFHWSVSQGNGQKYRRRECRKCQAERQAGWFERNKDRLRDKATENMKKWRARQTPEKIAEINRRQAETAIVRRNRVRAEVYAAYGGFRCACCGETEPMFLSIDHIENDGYELRKGGQPVGEPFLHWLKKRGFPPGYQILCMNCNHGKSRNGGICPHQGKEGSTIIPGEGVGASAPKRAGSGNGS